MNDDDYFEGDDYMSDSICGCCGDTMQDDGELCSVCHGSVCYSCYNAVHDMCVDCMVDEV